MLKLGLLSNANLEPWINWATLAPPLFRELERTCNAWEIAPPRFAKFDLFGFAKSIKSAYNANALFTMQISARPELPLLAVSFARALVRRAAFIADPWRHQLAKIAVSASVQQLNPCFVPYREAFDLLSKMSGGSRFRYLPFGIDTKVFDSFSAERDIDFFWMGRKYEPLHAALLAYADANGRKYLFRERTGFIEDPMQLGHITSRCKYFIVTPPDLDNPQRTGGFSPLTMRYFEGLAAGCRLLGVLPRSGEFSTWLPREAILEVKEDGSDLAERLAADDANGVGWEAVNQAQAIVREQHSWAARARTIVQCLTE